MIELMTEAPWLRLRPFRETCSGLRVDEAACGRLFVDALRWMTRMGAPWYPRPPAYGKGNSVYRRWAHGCDQGVWPRRRAYLQADPDLSAVLLDSTVVRAHVSAAGAPRHKKRETARGRSRGGFRTPIPILEDRRGCPLRLRVTGGPRHDRTQARALGKPEPIRGPA